MADTFTLKVLGNGQLPNAINDLYAVPASTSTIIKTITLVNTNSVAEFINLYILPNDGTARRIIPKDCELRAQYSLIFDDELTLETLDKIQGDSTNASKVDFTINGVEKS